MILVIDNYDSFTYNLVQLLRVLGCDVRVFRNDGITVGGIEDLSPSHIVISPGPSTPDNAGITLSVIKRFAGEIPILGVCLGHQAIGQAFGGRVVRAKSLMHGKTSPIAHDGQYVYSGLPQNFEAGRYHSLVIEKESFPSSCLRITASSPDGEIMGFRHKSLPVEGVQFHPESILTPLGIEILRNFVNQPWHVYS